MHSTFDRCTFETHCGHLFYFHSVSRAICSWFPVRDLVIPLFEATHDSMCLQPTYLPSSGFPLFKIEGLHILWTEFIGLLAYFTHLGTHRESSNPSLRLAEPTCNARQPIKLLVPELHLTTCRASIHLPNSWLVQCKGCSEKTINQFLPLGSHLNLKLGVLRRQVLSANVSRLLSRDLGFPLNPIVTRTIQAIFELGTLSLTSYHLGCKSTPCTCGSWVLPQLSANFICSPNGESRYSVTYSFSS